MNRRYVAVVCAAVLALFGTAGCADVNPFAAQASVASQGLQAGALAELTGALENSSLAVKTFQSTTGHLPSSAEFASIPGAASNSGATITYTPTANGFCLTATTTTTPVATGVWKDPGGMQPAGTTC